MTKEETIAQLKKEIEEFKCDKEVEDLRRELDELKNPSARKLTPNEEADILQARVRCVQLGVWHFIGGPIASWTYSIRTRNYIPSLVGTAVAIVGIPAAIVDVGLTLCVGAPVSAAALHIVNTTEKRRKLGITLPEEADKMLVV